MRLYGCVTLCPALLLSALRCVCVDGPSVFVFVVESALDPAVVAVAGLMQQQGALCLQQLHQKHQTQQQYQQGERIACALHNGKQQQQQQWPPGVLAVWQQQHRRRQQQQCARRLVVVAQAGLATTCSQKIHK